VGGSGELGECVQAPIARRLAPNVCSALAPLGACSQATLVPEIFLDFSPLERREPRSGDRFNDMTSREAARKKNLEVFLSPLRDS